MRAPRTLAAIAALSVLILAACGGGGEDERPISTPPAATATRAPQIDVPGKPNAFADYAGVVGIYLTQAGDAVLGAPCLSDLMEEWAMAEPNVPLAPEERCLVGNTDADPEDEVVVLFTAEPPEDSAFFGLFSNVVIFDLTDAGYVPVYESWTPDSSADFEPQRIVAAEDVTGDGNGNVVYTSTFCGAHTCTSEVHVLGDGYADLTPEEGIFMETADVMLEDQNGDGVPEIVLYGGTIGSVGAGPQRTRTEVHSWNGSTYELTETVYDPSDFLYFAIIDADVLFDAADYSNATAAYLAAIDDPDLIESGHFEKENERTELSAYALFRAGLAQLSAGDEAAGLASLQQSVDDYPDALNAGLADAFLPAYNTTSDIHSGCLAVRDYVDANLDDLQIFWDFGYSNPAFDAESVCPY